jgi:hypothetical protein
MFCENVERDYTAIRQGLQQIRGKAAGAAAGIEQQLVPSQTETSEDLFSPADMWLREAMVFGRIPFAGGI